ncbi:hydroxyethylthiazole kinase [Limosilactobacillus kribbianus]|uniref:hydroxyethylthiazole kinase n=1 Tax=Limosilactobacillus kribbianus TaxID=2982695 RepID=UPI00226448EA|nr:hydroxyethylthiazole kinase [Limosilactobacillus kribbianus]
MNCENLSYPLINRLRQTNPVVLTVANSVTIDKVADGLSAIGASPIMSKEPAEAAAMVKLANAITINLGTITEAQLKQIRAVLNANTNRLPVVLDPVAVGSVPYRLKIAHQLLMDYHFTVIRGNAGEIAALAGVKWQAHGIDAGQGHSDLADIAQQCARQYHSLVVLSGPTDFVTNGQDVFTNPLGDRYLALNVGSGDMLSSTLAAYLALGEAPLPTCSLACQAFAFAGVQAAKNVRGLGQWQSRFFDELCQLTSTSVRKRAVERMNENND